MMENAPIFGRSVSAWVPVKGADSFHRGLTAFFEEGEDTFSRVTYCGECNCFTIQTWVESIADALSKAGLTVHFDAESTSYIAQLDGSLCRMLTTVFLKFSNSGSSETEENLIEGKDVTVQKH